MRSLPTLYHVLLVPGLALILLISLLVLGVATGEGVTASSSAPKASEAVAASSGGQRFSSIPTVDLTATTTYTVFLPYVAKARVPAPCGGASLHGYVFQDYDGNGVQGTAYALGSHVEHPDGWLGAIGPISEPGIAGAVLQFDESQVASESDGWYEVCLPPGHHDVVISKDKYRFYFPSRQLVLELSEPLAVGLVANARQDFGLGVGLFTLPYELTRSDQFQQGSLTDIDPVKDEVGIYDCYPPACYWPDGQWAGDAHRGIDYSAPEGTPVIAAAPGFVYSVGHADDGSMMVVVVHTEYDGLSPWLGDRIHWANRGIELSYQHLARAADGISPGVFVSRGQVVGYLNDAVHLHVDARWHLIPGDWQSGGYVDLYRDLFHSPLVFLDHDSGSGYFFKMSQGSPGYWSADNQPYFP
jgi:murein DD-endopeptidase MepM/ murein hydrolase activator NlpD